MGSPWSWPQSSPLARAASAFFARFRALSKSVATIALIRGSDDCTSQYRTPTIPQKSSASSSVLSRALQLIGWANRSCQLLCLDFSIPYPTRKHIAPQSNLDTSMLFRIPSIIFSRNPLCPTLKIIKFNKLKARLLVR